MDTDINTLFEYIRSHKWDEFKSLLKNNDSIDLNFRDNQNNYLLTYAVRFNRPDIVNLLLQNGARYDIVDFNDRSILYDAIQSNFEEIIIILLNYSEKEIGINITNIRDINGNIPLHYAIYNNNEYIVDVLLKYNSNPHITDVNQYNSLHIAIKNGSINIVKLLIKNMTSLDNKTSRGETPLHMAINYQYNSITYLLLTEGANVNLIENESEFTPLHYAVGWNNITIISQLLSYNADPNIQDIYGNIPLMYCVKEDYDQSFDILMEKNINVNLWNMDGKIVLHEVLENYTDSKKYYVDKLIKLSNLSLQDYNGNSCLHYLVIHNIWESYGNILRKKKLNIFARNSNGLTVIDLFNEKKSYDKFLDIVTQSYLHILKKDKKNWHLEIDKICSRNFSTFSDEERSSLSINVKTNDDFEKKCYDLIRKKIENDILKMREGTLSHCQRSYPQDNIHNIDIDEGYVLDVCTFTGSILDVLFGLIYLIKKHNNVCTTLSNEYVPNEDLCNFYKSMGLIMNDRCEFLNFELVWIEYKLYIIPKFSELFDHCVKSNHRFIIIPLGIELKYASHANYLIYDKSVKELERFEPHGGTTPIGFNYNALLLDKILEEYFHSIDTDIQYIPPHKYIPKIGFQIMDSRETNKKRIGDPGGFCALWSIWYVDQRLTYNSYSRDRLIKSLFENISTSGISYRNMIRNYSRNIIKERDDLLKNVKMDINDWLNDNYTNLQLDKLMESLVKKINKCCVFNK